MRGLLSLSTFFLLLSSQLSFASIEDSIPQRPDPPRLVNDFADILTEEEEAALETKLVAFDDSTSTQIAVVTVTSLHGYDKADFAFKIGETWGVGQEGLNNGIVLLVKPKYGIEKGETYIAVGYGLEPVIPDVTARHIVEKEMIPNFKNGNMYKGIDDAIDVLTSLASEEFSAADYAPPVSLGTTLLNFMIGMSVLAAFLLTIVTFIFKLINKLTFWEALKGVLAGRDWSNRKSSITFTSIGSSSSSSGGSFKGFGGGSFGGGGAGGSW